MQGGSRTCLLRGIPPPLSSSKALVRASARSLRDRSAHRYQQVTPYNTWGSLLNPVKCQRRGISWAEDEAGPGVCVCVHVPKHHAVWIISKCIVVTPSSLTSVKNTALIATP